MLTVVLQTTLDKLQVHRTWLSAECFKQSFFPPPVVGQVSYLVKALLSGGFLFHFDFQHLPVRQTDMTSHHLHESREHTHTGIKVSVRSHLLSEPRPLPLTNYIACPFAARQRTLLTFSGHMLPVCSPGRQSCGSANRITREAWFTLFTTITKQPLSSLWMRRGNDVSSFLGRVK